MSEINGDGNLAKKEDQKLGPDDVQLIDEDFLVEQGNTRVVDMKNVKGKAIKEANEFETRQIRGQIESFGVKTDGPGESPPPTGSGDLQAQVDNLAIQKASEIKKLEEASPKETLWQKIREWKWFKSKPSKEAVEEYHTEGEEQE